MDINRALEIASSIAKGINPETGKPIGDQKSPGTRAANVNTKERARPPSPARSPTVQKYMYQVSEALVRHLADAHRGKDQIESLDDYLARRRKDCMPSLRMIGAEDESGWALVQAHWTILYWQERAIRAELLLKQNRSSTL